jgi:hypothetical protein
MGGLAYKLRQYADGKHGVIAEEAPVAVVKRGQRSQSSGMASSSPTGNSFPVQPSNNEAKLFQQ